MAVGGQLRKEQFVIDDKLKAPTIRGDEGDGFDLGFEFLQQFGCQTDSARGVVSNRTVGQFYIKHRRLLK